MIRQIPSEPNAITAIEILTKIKDIEFKCYTQQTMMRKIREVEFHINEAKQLFENQNA